MLDRSFLEVLTQDFGLFLANQIRMVTAVTLPVLSVIAIN